LEEIITGGEMVTFDGVEEEDKRLWYTYMYWARQEALSLGFETSTEPQALVDDPNRRLPEGQSISLRTMLFSCFALEYRLKRILKALKVPFDEESETFGPFCKKFWRRLESAERLDKKGKCTKPPEWAEVEEKLRDLIDIRNKIAHANYEKTLQYFSGKKISKERARELFNAVVDAIRILNQCTGYDVRPTDEVKEYFRQLKI
jgi:hypothetical protein